MHDASIFFNRGPRVKIFLGEFGSGKTELAVNYALQIKHLGYETALVDMDIAKPMFHSRSHRSLLESNGIEIVASDPKLAHAELPILPHDLNRVLNQPDNRVLIDVGGGESAIVLGQFRERIADNAYQAMLVVNAFRPHTDTLEGVIEVYHRIKKACGLTISHLISNANIGSETAKEHVLKGISLVEDASRHLRLPIHCVVVPKSLWQSEKIATGHSVFVLEPCTKYPWQ